MAKLEEIFMRAGNNGRSFRGAPFWSWNDDLEPDEIRRQVRELKRGGMGGHFMHSRPGLITPYFGRKWMQCVKAAVEESKKVELDAWLYDEDCWPSGTAADELPKRGPRYWVKRLIITESDSSKFTPKQEALATYLWNASSSTPGSARRISPSEARQQAKPGEKVFQILIELNKQYVDLLSAEVTDAFLKFGYEPYTKAIGGEFGPAIPGIFTDEPGYRAIPWTEKLPQAFAEKWGYDLFDSLLCLFCEAPGWRQVRHDFWHTATRMLVNNFTRRTFEWCDRHNLRLTGHMLGEDSLASQIFSVGAAIPHYRWMHWPGVDLLRRQITTPLLNKQVTSAARQLGRSRVLSESFAGAGWNMSFEDMKWIWNWQAVQGVNFLCQHVSQYSLKGLRKRDYPPSIFYQQPWWPDYRLFNDYLARLGAMLTSGRPVTEVLVIHPIESAWLLFDPQETRREELDSLNQSLVNLTDTLLSNQRDFDFGDEALLADLGQVEGESLRVGECSYKVVIIPASYTLRSSTIDLLEKFIASGGKIIFYGRTPVLVNGREHKSHYQQHLLHHSESVTEGDWKNLLQLLDRFAPGCYGLQALSKTAKIYSCERLLDNGRRIFFFTNLSRDKSAAASLAVSTFGNLQEWDCLTGEIREVPVEKSRVGLSAKLNFERAGSQLLVFDPKGKPLLRKPTEKVLRRQMLGKNWQIRTTEPNLLTLDYCHYKVGEGKWSQLLPTIEVNSRVLELPGNKPLAIRYIFQLDFLPAKGAPLWLLLETPRRFAIYLNGKKISSRDQGWWCDIAFRKIAIAAGLRRGKNVLEFHTLTPVLPPHTPYSDRLGFKDQPRMAKMLEIESCYLLGDFVVREGKPATKTLPPQFVLTPTTSPIRTGDLGPQGFPFYRGAVVYSQQVECNLRRGERAWLDFSGLEAIVCKAKVNGKKAGAIVWKPWKMEITQLLKKGVNKIEIEVVGSCRNMLGHHHNIHGEIFTHPDYFRMRNVWDNNRLAWTHQYNLIPFGLIGPVRILYTK